ncbi:pentatricopeptide repeat-containing protein At1g80880, mitochondrial isoform X1 [Rhodamnia argentea]|uniref:Pentatricopeptide repeat-containing protein At1g80880, mitochondrial isoform X1 n=1 Tax=Rhodamnia argentea TaxID=178133 RepID=A0A8B8QVN8_9MYRT|nr:pentatricopeptide repeat-containing protein At1g80880, mitochondrial isoform X1 [Rhodamnia argentea]
MALHALTTRLRQATCPHVFRSLSIFHISTLPSVSPLSHPGFDQLGHSLSGAFRRKPCDYSPCSHLSGLRFFSIQIRCDPDVVPEKSDPQESTVVELLKQVSLLPTEAEVMESLKTSGIVPNGDLICSVVWALREEWRLAVLAFKWGDKWGCIDEKVLNLMTWMLGSHGKFSIAWCLIRDSHRSSVDTRQAMLVMIDRYAAANNPTKAIWTFHVMEKFRTAPDEEAYCALLTALCKNGNIEEAEEFMLLNKKLFPLGTESFNIILNGWSNVTVDVIEAKRVWREMSRCCITPNATSYTHMICCFSKVSNLFDCLRLYDEMKKRGWVPGLEVYNSLIYVLTRENCFSEALKMLEKLKEEGLHPNHATYDSMIRPLCEAKKLDEARAVLSSMIGDNIQPTIETYHSFLEVTSFEGTLEVLSMMRKAGVGPTGDTFLLILEKFFKLSQVENALRIWVEMRQYEIVPVAPHYLKVVHGLATSGYLIKAKEIYSEMRAKGFLDDPKLKKLLYRTARRKKDRREWHAGEDDRGAGVNVKKGTILR